MKIIGPWTLVGCTRTTVTVDFDGKKSIWYHPNGHETEWILRPVIRVQGVGSGPITCPESGTDGSATAGTQPSGAACTAGSECASGSCVSNVCAGVRRRGARLGRAAAPVVAPHLRRIHGRHLGAG